MRETLSEACRFADNIRNWLVSAGELPWRGRRSIPYMDVMIVGSRLGGHDIAKIGFGGAYPADLHIGCKFQDAKMRWQESQFSF